MAVRAVEPSATSAAGATRSAGTASRAPRGRPAVAAPAAFTPFADVFDQPEDDEPPDEEDDEPPDGEEVPPDEADFAPDEYDHPF